MQYPKFEQKIIETIVRPQKAIDAHPNYGIIIGYDAVKNSATVIMSQKGSDDIGEVYQDVPCPISLGAQTVAPEAGRRCMVNFKDGSFNTPIITHFFSHDHGSVDYMRQTKSAHSLPRYMLGT